MRWGGARLGSGFPSPENEDWACSTSSLLFWMPGAFMCFCLKGEVFFASEVSDLHGSLQLLTSFHLWERDEMLLRAIFVWRCLERIPSWPCQEERRSLQVFVEKGTGMVHLLLGRSGTFSLSASLARSAWIAASCPMFALEWVVRGNSAVSVTVPLWRVLTFGKVKRCVGSFGGLFSFLDSS